MKCIYIDPPYNTGSENWIYNDNVNSPLINEWLGKVVGKDDLTRHDKWLCMMTPRLKLLRELLADDGVIFVSLDDNEQHTFRCLMDEMFGEENFVANIMWQKKYAISNDDDGIGQMHDFIICYSKTTAFERYLLPRTQEQVKRYTNLDEDPRGPWASAEYVSSKSKEQRPTLWYPIVHPETGEEVWPDPNAVWRYSKDKHEEMVKENRLYWGPTLNYKIPRIKKYISEIQEGIVPNTWWDFKEVGHNDEAKKEVISLFEDKNVFDTPKPVRLLKKILKISTKDNDIILDSFAGSGTTGQAVMELNKEDGGNRRFILIQMPESSEREPDKNICRDITRERLHRAIDKFGYRAGFQYWQVGQALDAETLLSGQLPTFETFARYVYYLCTGENLPDNQRPDADTYLVGTSPGRAIYLVYQPDFTALTKLALNLSLAQQMQQAHPKQKIVVYAPACFLDDEHLDDWQIEYVGIPYNLFQRTA